MKKTGLEIVEMIARGEAPKKIKYNDYIYEYINGCLKTYQTESMLAIDLIQCLNDEFEIIEENKKHFFIYSGGGIEDTDIFDNNHYETGNYFKTYEEAVKHLEKLKIYTKLKRYAEEHNTEKIDWRNEDQEKWYICFEKYENEFNTYCCCSCYKDLGQIYFTSEELCWKAIKEIGSDNVKKLFD